MRARNGGKKNSGQYRQVSFYTSNTFLKNVEQIKIMHIEQKFPFKTLYFLGVGGLTTSSYIVYVYTTSRHTDLYSIHLLYIKYIYISIQYIYLFLI